MEKTIKLRVKGKEIEVELPSVYQLLFKSGVNVNKLTAGEMSEYDKIIQQIAKNFPKGITLDDLNADEIYQLFEVVNNLFTTR